jgi:hypothetical protein
MLLDIPIHDSSTLRLTTHTPLRIPNHHRGSPITIGDQAAGWIRQLGGTTEGNKENNNLFTQIAMEVEKGKTLIGEGGAKKGRRERRQKEGRGGGEEMPIANRDKASGWEQREERDRGPGCPAAATYDPRRSREDGDWYQFLPFYSPSILFFLTGVVFSSLLP